jgi:hypothetical protein
MSSHSPEIRHLSKADPIMKRVVDDIGPYALTLRPDGRRLKHWRAPLLISNSIARRRRAF